MTEMRAINRYREKKRISQVTVSKRTRRERDNESTTDAVGTCRYLRAKMI